MSERRELAKKIQNIEISLGKYRLEQVKLHQEAEDKRGKEIKELFAKLELVINEEMIAVTHFTLN